MKSTRPTGGYTIVEVMIALAVAGGLLISSMSLISGQQRRTEFTTTARDLEHKFQDIFNDVETGYYANSGQLRCVSTPSSGPTISVTATAIGSNEGCIFLGKALRFFRTPSGATNYEAYTIAGKRQWQNGAQVEDVTNLTQANPKLFLSGTTGATESGIIYNALNIRQIKFVTSFGATTTYDIREGIAILSGISAKDSAGRNIASGDSRSYLASINISNSPAFPDDFNGFNSKINPTDIVARPLGAVICLSEGTGGRVAAIGVGVTLDNSSPPRPVPSGGRLATELFLDDKASRFGCTP